MGLALVPHGPLSGVTLEVTKRGGHRLLAREGMAGSRYLCGNHVKDAGLCSATVVCVILITSILGPRSQLLS